MNNSWKIGAISGLVAGFVAGIVHTVSAKIPASIGLYDISLPLITVAQNAYGVNVFLGIVFGAIFGIIYSRSYGLIPGKGVSRGLFFGLILWLVSWVRMSTLTAAYGFYLNASGEVLAAFFNLMVYGLVLVFLYESLRDRYFPAEGQPKIITYDMKGGILPGAIAGFVGGFVASIYLAVA